MMKRRFSSWAAALVVVLMAAVSCTCSGGGKGAGAGSGSSGPPRDPGAPLDPRCAQVRGAVEALYRDEATAAKLDAARTEEMVRDNTTMVMNECAGRPQQVAECAGKARSSQQLEADCLRPLDDEGTEGSTIRR
jgi:hypothetical protein